MKNCIINGDCTEVLKTIADESVDFVLTDPPYFVRYRDRTGRTIANTLRSLFSGPPRMVPSLFPTYRFTPTSRS